MKFRRKFASGCKETVKLIKVVRCSVCGESFETDRFYVLCDLCRVELKKLVELSRSGLI